MTGHAVPIGAIFHHSSRRRREVVITATLRAEVERLVPVIRDMLARGILPPPVHDARCRHCSLLDACQPAAVSATDRLRQLSAALYVMEEDEEL